MDEKVMDADQVRAAAAADEDRDSIASNAGPDVSNAKTGGEDHQEDEEKEEVKESTKSRREGEEE